eukprot:1140325-Pelagomonas_calceolata.AAC.7
MLLQAHPGLEGNWCCSSSSVPAWNSEGIIPGVFWTTQFTPSSIFTRSKGQSSLSILRPSAHSKLGTVRQEQKDITLWAQ